MTEFTQVKGFQFIQIADSLSNLSSNLDNFSGLPPTPHPVENMFNRAPRLRFQGRSHSAKEGPMFELGDSSNYNLPEQYNRYPTPTHRLLPITPDNKLIINNSLTPDYIEDRRFVRNAGRSSCTSLSPSEDRIRRTTQQKQEEVIKSGSTSKLSSRQLPSPFGLQAQRNSVCYSSPGNMHLSAATTYTENNLQPLLPPPPKGIKQSNSYKRLNFKRVFQRSMGQIDSRLNGTNEKPNAFKSFDGETNNATTTMQKVKPRRFDSTASEDSISTEPSQDDKSSTRFGSSGSLDFFTQNASSSASKKYSMDSRASQQQQQQRGQRSTSSKTSTTSRTLISPPRAGANNKKLPPISNSSQAIILYCMENARGDVASRVVARMAHKRDDFSNYCANMAPEHWNEFVGSLRTYLNEVVRHLQSVEKIREISMNFGIAQVPRRSIGFKADYFAVMANALTTECVFLDGAAHQPTEAIEAWAELVELMFSNVRDGYYQQIRFLRRNSQCYNGLFSQSSVSSELSADGSEGTPALPAAPSTTGTLVRQYSQEGTINNSAPNDITQIHQRFF